MKDETLRAQLEKALIAYKSGNPPSEEEFVSLKAAFESDKADTECFLHGVDALLINSPPILIVDNN